MERNKAVFIDRDGVINNDEGHYYVYKPIDFIINPDIPEALKLLADAGYLLIIISNQSGIGKGIYSKKDADTLHSILLKKLEEKGIPIAEIYFCPHHPDSGKCFCRKPDSLMIEKALARFQIDAKQSYLIGDGQRDVDAAEKAGVRGIKVEKNISILGVVKKVAEHC